MMQKYSAFPHASHDHMQSLMHCYTICSSCHAMCIKEGHKETALFCSNCADVCALAIKLHSEDSPFNKKIMDLCSEVCTKCAEACAKMKVEHCQQCSEVCKECAAACKRA